MAAILPYLEDQEALDDATVGVEPEEVSALAGADPFTADDLFGPQDAGEDTSDLASHAYFQFLKKLDRVTVGDRTFVTVRDLGGRTKLLGDLDYFDVNDPVLYIAVEEPMGSGQVVVSRSSKRGDYRPVGSPVARGLATRDGGALAGIPGGMKLKKLRSGLYETEDGEWMIEQGGAETPAWKGEWIVTNTRHRDLYSDPVPTFRAAKEVLAQMIVAKSSGKLDDERSPLSVPCPICGASAGRGCTTERGAAATRAHPERVRVARGEPLAGIPEDPGFREGYGRVSKSWAEQDRDALRAHVEANHANMTRFVWARRLVEDHLTKCRYWLTRERDGFFFQIDPSLPNDVVPWKLMGTDEGEKLLAASEGRSPGRDTFRLIGEGNGKMECPAWDLPAGATAIGGTCPGAAAGQTAVPLDVRRGQLSKDGRFIRAIPPGTDAQVPFREAAAICAACYAGEGNFGYSEQLAGNLLRYVWTRDLIRTPEGLREWVEVMAEAITSIRAAVAEDDFSERAIRPFRVHSSGDFFSPAYAKAWMHLANRVYEIDPSIRFWCPTRTWAAPKGEHGSAFNWQEILSILKHDNLVVRPSAYHVGDPAPGPLADHPAAAKGTTALVGPLGPGDKPGVFHKAFPEAISEGDDDPRADHNCPVYALKKADEVGSCGAARCRVCWTRPDVSVNYALH